MAADDEPSLAELWFIDKRVLLASRGVLRSTLANLLGEIGMRPDDRSLTVINTTIKAPVITGTSLIDLERFGDLVAEKLGRILERHIKPENVTFSRSPDNELWINVKLT